jgi:hypothetical protein
VLPQVIEQLDAWKNSEEYRCGHKVSMIQRELLEKNDDNMLRMTMSLEADWLTHRLYRAVSTVRT